MTAAGSNFSPHSRSLLTHPWLALQKAAEQWPDEPALVFPHQNLTLSFKDWYLSSRQFGEVLKTEGVSPQDHVGLYAENRVEWAVIQLAVASIDAIFVPLNTHYRRDDLKQALEIGNVSTVIASESFRGNPFMEHLQEARGSLEHELKVLDIRSCSLINGKSGFVVVNELDTRNDCHDGSSDDSSDVFGDDSGTASILFTSGTTGLPKGTELSHRAMMLNAGQTAQRLGITAGDRWTSIIPLFHCAGCIMNLLGCLQSGACYVGVPSFNAGDMLGLIEKEKCTHLSGVPTSWLAMLQHANRHQFNLSSLRGGTCGGADANPDILKRCADEFPVVGLAQVYGQTESGTLVSCPRFDDENRLDTAGPALPGYEIRIVDATTGQVMQDGDIGEIQARGELTMKGYYNNAKATAQTLDFEGWLHTGDLGFLTEEKNLVIAGGRLRDMIIRGGENIYPAEIEQLLLTHELVDEVAIFGLPDEHYGEIVAAAIRFREGSTQGLNDNEKTAASSQSNTAIDSTKKPSIVLSLQEYCAGRIAKFKVPVVIFRVDTFPQTASGKIRKVELRQMAEQGVLSTLA